MTHNTAKQSSKISEKSGLVVFSGMLLSFTILLDGAESTDQKVTPAAAEKELTDQPKEGEEQGEPGGRIAEELFEGRYRRVYSLLEEPLGLLPEGWEDRSGPGAKVRYGPSIEAPVEGEKALMIHVASTGLESAQLEFGPVPIIRDQRLRLGLSVRSLMQTRATMGLRSGEGESKVYLEQPIAGGVEWTSGRLVVETTVDDPEARFYVRIDEPGIIEIDAMYIERYEPAPGFVTALTSEESPNLLPTSSFPDGVHPPWALLNAREHFSDRVEIGPTGIPSLRFSGRGSSLTAPIFSQGSGGYTFSLYLKGSKRGQTLSIILSPPDDNPQVYPYHQTLSLDTVWRRYTSTVPIKPSPVGIILAHIISHTGEAVWVDGMQVEKSKEMSPLARTAAVEIVAQPRNPHGISFEGEALGIKVTAYGRPMETWGWRAP